MKCHFCKQSLNETPADEHVTGDYTFGTPLCADMWLSINKQEMNPFGDEHESL